MDGLRTLKALGIRTMFSAVETTTPREFEEAKPGDSLGERIRLLHEAHDVGMRTGTVIMNGLGNPVRTLMDLRHEVPWLDYIYVSTFSPVPGTPWEGKAPASVNDSIDLVALARLMFPCAHIALADVLPEAGDTSRYLIHELAAGAGNTFSGLLVYKYASLNCVDELRRAWQWQILK
jgi:biotin synthase-like enzyme